MEEGANYLNKHLTFMAYAFLANKLLSTYVAYMLEKYHFEASNMHGMRLSAGVLLEHAARPHFEHWPFILIVLAYRCRSRHTFAKLKCFSFPEVPVTIVQVSSG